jgi:hypothetical protein
MAKRLPTEVRKKNTFIFLWCQQIPDKQIFSMISLKYNFLYLTENNFHHVYAI